MPVVGTGFSTTLASTRCIVTVIAGGLVRVSTSVFPESAVTVAARSMPASMRSGPRMAKKRSGFIKRMVSYGLSRFRESCESCTERIRCVRKKRFSSSAWAPVRPAGCGKSQIA